MGAHAGGLHWRTLHACLPVREPEGTESRLQPLDCKGESLGWDARGKACSGIVSVDAFMPGHKLFGWRPFGGKAGTRFKNQGAFPCVSGGSIPLPGCRGFVGGPTFPAGLPIFLRWDSFEGGGIARSAPDAFSRARFNALNPVGVINSRRKWRMCAISVQILCNFRAISARGVGRWSLDVLRNGVLTYTVSSGIVA